ncbi:hypothetical protein JCM24511_02238 [Saitozyma sp. JCM 24511]|nr:hypothetical protein JCM24511_02238 [Saitozyma sp. JCM 24511]
MYPSPSDSRDGFILVTVDAEPEVHDPATPVLQALRSESWNEVVARLVETFLASTSPRIPIVVREEVSEASPLLLHAMAAVAATRRNCPKEIFAALRSIVRKEMLEQDTTSDPTRQNVQILLVSCLIDDLAVQSGTAAPLSVSRSRLTAAFRMAQDLGMDRDSGTSLSESDRRIWLSAIVIDQWSVNLHLATFKAPLTETHAEPTPRRNAIRMGMRPIFDATQLSHVKAGGEDYFEQLVGLSVLGARVMRVVYGPDGLKKAGNHELLSLRDDLLKWKSGLSGPLQFTGVWSTLPAGILHTLHTALYLLLHRPFMRFSFIVPQNLELNVDLEVWVVLATASRLAIEWAANQDDIADLLFFGPYALGLCAWVQYHTWARRREWDGVLTLEKGKAAVTRWTTGMGQGHLPILQAQLEIIPLFHTLTSSTHSTFSTDRGLNPTPGILNRLPETSIAGITFLRDPSHPRGGVLVATRQAAREIKDLPEDTVIIGGPLEEGDQTANASGTTNAQEMSMSLPASMSGLVTGDPRFGISTPDWEAAVAALTTYNGFDSLVQGSV